jgi:hypothetical protein
MKTTKTERPLTERFAETHPSFRAKIQAIAGKAEMTPLDVYALWLEYSDQCSSFDQSAVMSEFEQWYSDRLNPAAAPLTERDELLAMLQSALAYIEAGFPPGEDLCEVVTQQTDDGPEVEFAIGEVRRLVERLGGGDDPRSTCPACNAVTDGPVPPYCLEHDGDYASFLAFNNCD